MGKQYRSWSVEEKLAIVLAVLSERPSVAEIARQHGVNIGGRSNFWLGAVKD